MRIQSTTERGERRTGTAGEAPTTASGGNLVGAEVIRNERSVQWTAATIEDAEFGLPGQSPGLSLRKALHLPGFQLPIAQLFMKFNRCINNTPIQ